MKQWSVQVVGQCGTGQVSSGCGTVKQLSVQVVGQQGTGPSEFVDNSA